MAKSISATYADGLSEPKQTLSMDEKMCKGMKDMKVGDECCVMCKGKITKVEKSEWTNNKTRVSMEISSMGMDEKE